MPGLYSHTTRATGLILTASIYNTDHENHITNHVPAQIDDYSSDVTEMRSTTDPGESGSESQATHMGGEIERLRYVLKELKGGSNHWYESLATGMVFDLNGAELILNTTATTAIDSIRSDTDGQVDFKIAGADDFRMTANLLAALDGSSVVVGHTAAITVNNTPTLQVAGTAGGDSDLLIARFSADAGAAGIHLMKSRNATIGSNTIVQDNDQLGYISFAADDGTDFVTEGARIFARVNGTPGLNDMPTELVFAVTANGSATPAEEFIVIDGSILPATHAGTSIGLTGTRFNNIWLSGNITYTGTITDDSDGTLKENIRDKKKSTGDFRALRLRDYVWKESQDADTGLIAQEVESIYPELVATYEDGKKGVKIDKMLYQMIEVIQGLAERVEQLEAP